MKYILLVTVLLWGFNCSGQILEFSEEKFDFGDIDNLNRVSKEIELKNTGENPLIIESVKASCGCTASSLTKKELEPMGTSTVTVSFNPKGRSGKQNKSVTFVSNDHEKKVKKIFFTANVVPIWEVKPKRLEFKGKPDGSGFEVSEKLIFVNNLGTQPIVIQEIISKNENLTVLVPEEKEIKPGEKLKLTAQVKPDFAPQYNVSASIDIAAKVGTEITNSSVRVLFRPPPASNDRY